MSQSTKKEPTPKVNINQYWIRDKASSESDFGKIAFLKTVCWLQLNGEIEDVPPGKYIAYLRANFHSNNFSLNYRVGFGHRDVLHACDVGPDQSRGENEAVIYTQNGEVLPSSLLQVLPSAVITNIMHFFDKFIFLMITIFTAFTSNVHPLLPQDTAFPQGSLI